MVLVMVAAVLTNDAAVALVGAATLVIVALVEAAMLRRASTTAEMRSAIVHRSLCFIAMAFLLVVMQHPSAGAATHQHQGILMPALLAMTGAALIMATIMTVRQVQLLGAAHAPRQQVTHYVVESGGMVLATSLMLVAALLGH